LRSSSETKRNVQLRQAKVEAAATAPLQQVDRTYVLWRKRKLVYFGGCDYFRLSSDARVKAAAQEAIEKFGLNVAASRRTTGNHQLYEQLETELGRFFQADSAVLVSSGYLANIVAAQAWAGKFSAAFIDERAHSSLVHAALFLNCPVRRFRHRDPKSLARVLKRSDARGPVLLLTDGMFAHDGSIAPLAPYQRVLGRKAWMLVDDAHAAGVLGKHGRGSIEFHELDRDRVIQTITLSKAFGAYGGAVIGPAAMRELCWAHSGVLTGNTPLPLPLAAAALVSLALLETDATLRGRLEKNIAKVRSALVPMELADPTHVSPIFALPADRSGRFGKALLARGIFPTFIQYPGGPRAGYFRFAISSEHTDDQLTRLIDAIAIGTAAGHVAIFLRRASSAER